MLACGATVAGVNNNGAPAHAPLHSDVLRLFGLC
jgi:hypothetical protein